MDRGSLIGRQQWFPKEHRFKGKHSMCVPWLCFPERGITLKCIQALSAHWTEKAPARSQNAALCGWESHHHMEQTLGPRFGRFPTTAGSVILRVQEHKNLQTAKQAPFACEAPAVQLCSAMADSHACMPELFGLCSYMWDSIIHCRQAQRVWYHGLSQLPPLMCA